MPRSVLHLTVIASYLLLAAGADAGLRDSVRFQSLAPIPLALADSASPQAVALADLNKDGIPDLIAVEPDNGLVAVSIGHGDGTFAEPVEYEIDGTPTAVAVADLGSPFASDSVGDVDGNVDLVVVDDFGEAFIFLGRGDGTFDPPEQDLSDVLDALELNGIAFGDFDHNGRTDLALLDTYDCVYFLCNIGGSFAPCATDFVATDGDGALAIAAGDFDGNGELDIVVLNGDSADLSPIYGTGDGNFDEPTSTVSASAEGEQTPQALAAGRINGDMVDDVMVGDHDLFYDLNLLGLYGHPNRGFDSHPASGPFALTGLALGDVDNDGALDLLMVASDEAGPMGVVVSPGDGTGSFAQPYPALGMPSGSWRGVLAADLNHDGKLDVAVVAADGASLVVGLNQTTRVCPGDCNHNLAVSIDELVLGVGLALNSGGTGQCPALDVNANDMVEINELVAAVASALAGCPS
jgi:hypothetical protein